MSKIIAFARVLHKSWPDGLEPEAQTMEDRGLWTPFEMAIRSVGRLRGYR